MFTKYFLGSSLLGSLLYVLTDNDNDGELGGLSTVARAPGAEHRGPEHQHLHREEKRYRNPYVLTLYVDDVLVVGGNERMP